MKKPRRNPWTKRRAKEKFKETLQKIEESPVVIEKLKEHKGILSEVKQATDDVDNLTNKYMEMTSKIKVKVDESFIQDLSITNLKDLIDIEKTGKVQKAQFKDVIKAGEVRREALEALDSKDELLAKSKMVYLDLLQAKIDALIDLLGDDKDE
jgi:ribosome assembly protein YihI (activator of Der GTPase)